MLDMTERGVPDEVPAHWQVYFAVEDTDAAVEQVKQSGGSVDGASRWKSRRVASRSSPTPTARASP